jgi:hypothetical protein
MFYVNFIKELETVFEPTVEPDLSVDEKKAVNNRVASTFFR